MDYVYRIWIQPVEKVKESLLITAQLTSYDFWCDTLRRTHHRCESTAKMFHLNVIMTKQTYSLKDILQSSCLGSSKASVSWKKKRPRSSLILMETNERGRWNAMHHPGLDCRSGGKTSYRGPCRNKEETLNMGRILYNVKFPECDNCVTVVKSRGKCLSS